MSKFCFINSSVKRHAHRVFEAYKSETIKINIDVAAENSLLFADECRRPVNSFINSFRLGPFAEIKQMPGRTF